MSMRALLTSDLCQDLPPMRNLLMHVVTRRKEGAQALGRVVIASLCLLSGIPPAQAAAPQCVANDILGAEFDPAAFLSAYEQALALKFANSLESTKGFFDPEAVTLTTQEMTQIYLNLPGFTREKVWVPRTADQSGTVFTSYTNPYSLGLASVSISRITPVWMANINNPSNPVYLPQNGNVYPNMAPEPAVPYPAILPLPIYANLEWAYVWTSPATGRKAVYVTRQVPNAGNTYSPFVRLGIIPATISTQTYVSVSYNWLAESAYQGQINSLQFGSDMLIGLIPFAGTTYLACRDPGPVSLAFAIGDWASLGLLSKYRAVRLVAFSASAGTNLTLLGMSGWVLAHDPNALMEGWGNGTIALSRLVMLGILTKKGILSKNTTAQSTVLDSDPNAKYKKLETSGSVPVQCRSGCTTPPAASCNTGCSTCTPLQNLEAPYTAADFPTSAYVNNPKAGYAAQQATISNSITKNSRSGQCARDSFEAHVTSGREKRQVIYDMEGYRSISTGMADSMPNQPFKTMAESYGFTPISDLHNSSALFPNKNVFSDLLELEESALQFERGKITGVLQFNATLSSGQVVPSTVVAKTATGRYYWSHTELASSGKMLDDAFARLDRVRGPSAACPTPQARVTEFAHATYMYYNSMPFTRGSAGAGNAWLAGQFKASFNKRLPFVDGLDRRAMSSTQADFVQWYSTLIFQNVPGL